MWDVTMETYLIAHGRWKINSLLRGQCGGKKSKGEMIQEEGGQEGHW